MDGGNSGEAAAAVTQVEAPEHVAGDCYLFVRCSFSHTGVSLLPQTGWRHVLTCSAGCVCTSATETMSEKLKC